MGAKRLLTKEQVEWGVMSNLSSKELAKELSISISFAEKIIHGNTRYSKLKRETKKRVLTDDQVRAIREDTRPQKEVAEQYGCVPSMVSGIKSYLYYGDVPGPDSKPTKKRGPNRKLTAEQILKIREPTEKKIPLKYWALTYNVSIATIFNALNNIYYVEIEKPKEPN